MAIPVNQLRNVAFSTQFTYERVHMKGTTSTTLGGTAVVYHNLGYTPYMRIFYLYPGAGAFPASQSPSSPYGVIVNPYSDRVEIQCFPGLFGTFGQAVTLYYRIYKDKAI